MKPLIIFSFAAILFCACSSNTPQNSATPTPTPSPTSTPSPAVSLSEFAQGFKEQCPPIFASVKFPAPLTAQVLCDCVAIKLDTKIKQEPTLFEVWKTDKSKLDEFSKSTTQVCLDELTAK